MKDKKLLKEYCKIIDIPYKEIKNNHELKKSVLESFGFAKYRLWKAISKLSNDISNEIEQSYIKREIKDVGL